jgi:hypothetical protein
MFITDCVPVEYVPTVEDRLFDARAALVMIMAAGDVTLFDQCKTKVPWRDSRHCE